MGSSLSKCQLAEKTSERCEVYSTGQLLQRGNERSTTSLTEVHEDIQELNTTGELMLLFHNSMAI